MTTVNQMASRSARSYLGFRFAAIVFATLLSIQCIWLIIPELVRPRLDQIPTSALDAAEAAGRRDAALYAAKGGMIRGDLWADAAFTYAGLLWTKGGSDLVDKTHADRARDYLNRALSAAPHQSGAWLLLAGLEQRFPSAAMTVSDALKLSYYTGASEASLLPLRLRIAVGTNRFDDVELAQFVSRDLRWLVNLKQNAVLIAAYNEASPTGKIFIEKTIRDIDPSVFNVIRALPPR
jgi:hypothetical protein